MGLFTYYLIPFIVILGILIFFHEFGHFIIAKLFGVKVLRFSLGFGKKVIGRQMGETEYQISAIPLGGYVKMLGEDKDEEDEESEPIPPEDLERAFSHKHPLTRIAIVAAGPIFNFILAYLLFVGIFIIQGAQVHTTEVGGLTKGAPAEIAGLKKGDIIRAVNGQTVNYWYELKDRIMDRAGESLVFKIEREGQLMEVSITPEVSTRKNIFGEEVKEGLIGITRSEQSLTIELGILESFGEAAKKTWDMIELTVLSIIKLIQGKVPLDMIGGPIRIGQMTGEIAQISYSYLIPFMAIISIGLGILNLVPIPILDGGVIFFLFLELILGKPLGDRKREIAQKIGLFLIILLMAFVFYNDILYLLKPFFEQTPK
jgi:regulator of sigma E protease